MQVQPYVFFNGRCEEAIEFYQGALDAEVKMLMRFKDSPDPKACSGGNDNKIMHAEVRIGQTSMLMSDGRCEGGQSFQGFGLSVTVADAPAAERLFTALSDGGKVQMPLGKTFFSPAFGMLADRFGVLWMVYVGK